MATPDRLAFIGNRHHSGTIRAHQIADYLGATVYDDGIPELPPDTTCVVIKDMPPPEIRHLKCYVDVLDGRLLRYKLAATPDVGVIAFTRESRRHLNMFLGRRDTIYLPQHHCNFERVVRPPRDIRTVGFVGSRSSLSWPVRMVEEKLAAVGLEFFVLMLRLGRPMERHAVTEFYKHIDIQIFCRTRTRFTQHRFKDSLKILNAGSYRIPTVGSPIHTGVGAMPGMMVVREDIDQIVAACAELRDNPEQYETVVNNVYPLTEAYHISHIAPMYLQL